MFYKLAFKNVRKSFRDYTVYFLTLMFAVCIFYLFNSLGAQSAMINLSKSQARSIQSLSRLIGYISVFVAVILGFLAVYANNFLMKRRKKELGVYMVLGMKKRSISNIIITETFSIGIVSLAAGLAAGVFASQGLSAVTASLFKANLKPFRFVFSSDALLKTVVYFGIIFLVIMFFNTVSVSRLKIINLLGASRQNEKFRVSRTGFAAAAFIISVACLATAYTFIIQSNFDFTDKRFLGSIILGSIGTLLFFMSLSGFALKIAQSHKKFYLKNLNMFVIRQINSKVNTNFVSMSVICIMLLITIGTLSTGIGVSNALSSNLESSAPYDISLQKDATQGGGDIVGGIQKGKNGIMNFAGDYAQNSRYDTDITYGQLIPGFTQYGDSFLNSTVPAMSVSDYNSTAALLGRQKISLGENEFTLVCNIDSIIPSFEDFCKSGGTVSFAGKKLTAYAGTSESSMKLSLSNSGSSTNAGVLVVPDSLLKGLKPVYVVLNINYGHGVTDEEFTSMLSSAYPDDAEKPYDISYSKEEVRDDAATSTVFSSYVALYIGLVFLIAGAAVLALQQLSEAADNTVRYGLLRKLGADGKMVNRALLAQIAVYFLLPLALAAVHSAVGIYAVNKIITLAGHLNVLTNTLATAGIFVAVYGAYFAATYFGAKNMI